MGSNHMHDLFRRKFQNEQINNQQDKPLVDEKSDEITLSGGTPPIDTGIWLDQN